MQSGNASQRECEIKGYISQQAYYRQMCVVRILGMMIGKMGRDWEMGDDGVQEVRGGRRTWKHVITPSLSH